MVTSAMTATTFLRGYLGYLKGDGWDVTLICSEGPGIEELVSDAGVTLVKLEMRREPSLLHDLGSLIGAVRVMRKLRPDVLVYATPKAALVGAVSGWISRVPTRAYELWGLRLETATGLARIVFWILETMTMRLSTVVIANSRSMAARADELRLSKGRALSVLGPGSSHGVDADYFSRSAEMPKLSADLADRLSDEGVPVVGFIGRMHPDKGIDVLITALRICADRGHGAQLLIVGSDEGAQVATVIKGAGGAVRVHAIGFSRDIRPMLKAMDILVLPSLREGFPNVVLEAAAMEVPAIVSDATGCIDAVIDGVTGQVVPVGDPVALADAIVKMLADDSGRKVMGAAGRLRAVTQFAPATIWSLHSEAWREAANLIKKSAMQ
ncbi:glycosyltransferase family 4 protein [Microbacterium esteraromaticum]|uniref:glycosyltransferase family 4 protein n=1 Tax=Microbacterium esteraromaticum TaxID=57043 RepID=UPI0030950F45